MQISISLTPKQLKKLAIGHAVQLSSNSIKGGEHKIDVHPLTYKKIMRARKSGKGIRLMLSQDEIQGSGLLDVLKNMFEGGKKVFGVAKKVYEPFKPFLAPILKQATQNLAQQGISKLGEKSPFAAEIAKQVANPAIDLVGQKTGAFGYNMSRKISGGALQNNYSPFLSPNHPAMQSMNRIRLPDPGAFQDFSNVNRRPVGRGMLSNTHPAMQSFRRVRLPDPQSFTRGGRMPHGGSFRAF